MGLATLEFVELDSKCVENAPNTRVVCQHHAAHLVLGRHVRTFLRQGHLDRGGTPWNKVGELPFTDPLERLVNLGGVDIALNNVEDRDVGAFLHTAVGQDVLGLQKTAHHVKHRGLADRLHPCVDGQGSVTCHQEMAARRRDQRSYQSHQVVVHVARVAECGGGGGHNGTDNGVHLLDSGVLELEPVRHHASQRAIVDHDHCISVQSQSLQRQDAIVRLDNHIVVVWEHRISLNQLLWVPIVEGFKQV